MGHSCGCDSCEKNGGEDGNPSLWARCLVSLLFFGLSFLLPEAVSYPTVLAAYIIAGLPTLTRAGRNALKVRFFDESALMTVATLGAIAIGSPREAAMVMIFFEAGEAVSRIAEKRTNLSVSALLELTPEVARVVTGDKTVEKAPSEVIPGELIELRPGERVPLDGLVVSNGAVFDTSSVTGEAIPRSVSPGGEVMAGVIVLDRPARIRVTRALEDSTISRMLRLVQEAAERKSSTERFITRFSRVYTPVVVAAAAALAFVPYLLGGDLLVWGYRALVLLVISCPCALVISVPMGYVAGLGREARAGILVKGAVFIDALAGARVVALDKTGTITRGDFSVIDLMPESGFTREELLAAAARAETSSNHPIALSIVAAAGAGDSEDLLFEEVKGEGIIAGRKGGGRICVGNDRLLHRLDIPHPRCDLAMTTVHVVIDDSYAGAIVLGDRPREESPRAVEHLRQLGIKAVILTGDDGTVAAKVAAECGVDEFRAELSPEEKVSSLIELKESMAPGETVLFAGDGINDAPVIAAADCGIAMGGIGSDAAIEAADCVITADSPSRIPEAVVIARKTRRIVHENIGVTFAVKGIFIILGAFGLATMWEAVFADVGVTLIAAFNSLRLARG